MLRILTITAIFSMFACQVHNIDKKKGEKDEAEAEEELAGGGTLKSSGMRNFREINATMSVLTGMPSSQVFNDVSIMLPRGNSAEGFSSTVQVGIFRLATDYCERLSGSAPLRAEKFPNLNLSTSTPEDIATSFTEVFWGHVTTAAQKKLITDYITEIRGAGINERTLFRYICVPILASGNTIFH